MEKREFELMPLPDLLAFILSAAFGLGVIIASGCIALKSQNQQDCENHPLYLWKDGRCVKVK